MSPLEMFFIGELIASCEGCGMKLWSFFETREEMMAYIERFSQPPVAKLSVVESIDKKRKPH